ncbi:hypothetical protein TSUD_240280 [Trifolium subterraneum]|uniref:Uncharacterized protein n=1 Tax=Trifolium subterraneum TaxID=3900 RepID=A0A2Z6PKK5_TRISU|nr:hypothetical protein TSUD_240280 [Trifolium subterraneum]
MPYPLIFENEVVKQTSNVDDVGAKMYTIMSKTKEFRDPSRVTLLAAIGNVIFETTLLDLGSSSKYVLLATIRKNPKLKIQPATSVLQFFDTLVSKLCRKLEGVDMQASDFKFNQDLVIDMEEKGLIPYNTK